LKASAIGSASWKTVFMSKRAHRRHAAQSHTSTFNPGAPPRQIRLEHILLDELQRLIRDDATDPSLDGIVVLSVHLSPDAGHARIAYAVIAALAEETQRARTAQEGLERATGFLRAQLAQHLNLKRLPKLSFTFVGVQEREPCPD
jgi:ribosome-binding factor A